MWLIKMSLFSQILLGLIYKCFWIGVIFITYSGISFPPPYTTNKLISTFPDVAGSLQSLQFQAFANPVCRIIVLLLSLSRTPNTPLCSPHPKSKSYLFSQMSSSMYQESLPQQNLHGTLYLFWQWLLCILYNMIYVIPSLC